MDFFSVNTVYPPVSPLWYEWHFIGFNSYLYERTTCKLLTWNLIESTFFLKCLIWRGPTLRQCGTRLLLLRQNFNATIAHSYMVKLLVDMLQVIVYLLKLLIEVLFIVINRILKEVVHVQLIFTKLTFDLFVCVFLSDFNILEFCLILH